MISVRALPRPLVLLCGAAAGLLLGVGAPALAQQSGAPKPVPTAPPAPTPTVLRPNAAVAGQLPERLMMYTKHAKLSTSGGGNISVSVECNSTSDVPVAGACASLNTAATLNSSDMLDWGDTSRRAQWRCAFIVPSLRNPIELEASITCKKTQ